MKNRNFKMIWKKFLGQGWRTGSVRFSETQVFFSWPKLHRILIILYQYKYCIQRFNKYTAWSEETPQTTKNPLQTRLPTYKLAHLTPPHPISSHKLKKNTEFLPICTLSTNVPKYRALAQTQGSKYIYSSQILLYTLYVHACKQTEAHKHVHTHTYYHEATTNCSFCFILSIYMIAYAMAQMSIHISVSPEPFFA